jgi:hypothetical protein
VFEAHTDSEQTFRKLGRSFEKGSFLPYLEMLAKYMNFTFERLNICTQPASITNCCWFFAAKKPKYGSIRVIICIIVREGELALRIHTYRGEISYTYQQSLHVKQINTSTVNFSLRRPDVSTKSFSKSDLEVGAVMCCFCCSMFRIST